MKEIINICLSQSAGHLQCHFNNQQELYLDYSGGHTNKTEKKPKTKIDPQVFLQPVVNSFNNTVSYTPRTILLDAENGYGSLSKYEYSPITNEEEPNSLIGEVEKIQLQDRVLKNDYQKMLDSGVTSSPLIKKEEKGKPILLNTNNTKYWTDYTRLIYDPISFQQMHHWINDKKPVMGHHNHQQTVLKSDMNRKVIDFEYGVQEFKETNEMNFMDDCFRMMLERCDNLSGINLISEMDNSWGGVCETMLVDIRDEYLPKTAITVWGLYNHTTDDDIGIAELRLRFSTKVKSTMSCMLQSSMFVPMDLDVNQHSSESMWQSLALLSMAFENVNLLYAKTSGDVVVSMDDYINGITMGELKRKLVTDLKLSSRKHKKSIDLNKSFFSDDLMVSERKRKRGSKEKTRIEHIFSKSYIQRVEDDFEDDLDSKEFNELISKGTSARGLLQYNLDIPFNTLDSFPQSVLDTIVDDNNNYKLGMGIGINRIRPVLKDWKLFVQKMMRGDERDLYVDEIEGCLGEYEYGWSDDDDDGDDY